MNIFKHMIENLFVTATGIAALIHSTWSLGTLFTGNQPDPTNNMLGFLGWIIPALLIAFALDIGQIFTSAEIRKGDKRKIKYVTFGIFAVATYYLQWLYMAHHIPLLALENGIRTEWLPQVTLLRDMAIWIVPAFMPLSTALYTISQQNEAPEMSPGQLPTGPGNKSYLGTPKPSLPDTIDDDHLLPEIVEGDDQETEPYEPVEANNAKTTYYNLTCEHCGWETGNRLRLDSAERALRTHESRYCTVMIEEVGQG